MTKPLVSIIIATHNAEKVLVTCLESIALQTYHAYEVILQDNQSTDTTLKLAQDYKHKLSHLILFSEKDSGIYDAWNKALTHISGEWVLFLGADDTFLRPDSLQSFADTVKTVSTDIEYLVYPVVLTNDLGRFCDTALPSTQPLQDLKNGMCFPHQGVFHKCTLFAEQTFNPVLTITGDQDFLSRTLTSTNYQIQPLPLTTMSIGGISTQLGNCLQKEQETLQVSHKYYPANKPFLLYLRLCRATIFKAINTLFGLDSVNRFADFLRKYKKKTPLWNKSTQQYFPDQLLVEKPLVSLLIATVNRTTELEKLLQTLTEQTYPHFEVLIADQNPPETLESIIRQFQNKLTIHTFPCLNNGVSAARNKLLPLAKGNIVAFPDDDCWYDSACIETVVQTFLIHPYIQGLMVSWSEKNNNQQSTNTLSLVDKYSCFQRGETYTQFFCKAALQSLYFDPRLGPGTGLPYGCGEDTDFMLQVIDKKHFVGRTNAILVHHKQVNFADPIFRSDIFTQKIQAYALGRMHLLRKHSFPLWFKLANVFFPLLALCKEGPKAFSYRKTMFIGRLKGFFNISQ